jgi:reactive intermediate/imine deaminase
MGKTAIRTDSAPAAIGAYSQAISVDGLLFVSGQIPLDPETMEIVGGGSEVQIRRAFSNLSGVCQAADATLNDIVRLTVYLADLKDFPLVNQAMEDLFEKPYPARAALQVAALPKGASIEVDAIVKPGVSS